MKYQNKSFFEFYGSKEYRDNWENIFGKKFYKINKNCHKCGVELKENESGLCEICDKWLKEYMKEKKEEKLFEDDKEEQNRKLVLETLHNLYGKK